MPLAYFVKGKITDDSSVASTPVDVPSYVVPSPDTADDEGKKFK